MNELRLPSGHCRQLSGSSPDGTNILSVLLKLTYTIDDRGRLELAPEPLPLVEDLRPDAQNPKVLDADSDLYPFKCATDVVVSGHAYGHDQPRRFGVTVRVGKVSKSIAVVGDRRAALAPGGRVVFSEPDPVPVMRLGYDRAYGGRDTAASARYGNPWEELGKYLGESLNQIDVNPYDYPRNPAGRGFVVEATPDALEQLELPNLEDPRDPLTADRLAAGGMGRWPEMPLPQSLGWVDPGWFPRLAYFGAVPDHDPVDHAIAEVERGFAPADLLAAKPLVEKFDFRCASGASLGLQLPYLRGDEPIRLENLHPTKPLLELELPGERPRLWTDGRKGKLNATKPVLHTLLIEPDAMRLAMVWRGCAPALRPYMPEELKEMPLRAMWD